MDTRVPMKLKPEACSLAAPPSYDPAVAGRARLRGGRACGQPAAAAVPHHRNGCPGGPRQGLPAGGGRGWVAAAGPGRRHALQVSWLGAVRLRSSDLLPPPRTYMHASRLWGRRTRAAVRMRDPSSMHACIPVPGACRGGVGRAGMMAACVLLRLGACTSAAEAIQQVGKGGAIYGVRRMCEAKGNVGGAERSQGSAWVGVCMHACACACACNKTMYTCA